LILTTSNFKCLGELQTPSGGLNSTPIHFGVNMAEPSLDELLAQMRIMEELLARAELENTKLKQVVEHADVPRGRSSRSSAHKIKQHSRSGSRSRREARQARVAMIKSTVDGIAKVMDECEESGYTGLLRDAD
jgi:hypothetical protein